MRFTKFGSRVLIIAVAIIVCASVATAAIMWLPSSPEGKKDVVVVEPTLFSQPTIALNESVAVNSPYGGLAYKDANVTAASFVTGTHYYLSIDAVPTEEARQKLAEANQTGFLGWIWVVEVLKDGIQASDVDAIFLTYYMVAAGPVDVNWNSSQSGRLVAVGPLEPGRGPASSPPVWTLADGYDHANMRGWISFNASGEYTIKAYLVDWTADIPPYGPPPLDGISAQSPVMAMALSASIDATPPTGDELFSTPIITLNESVVLTECCFGTPPQPIPVGYGDANVLASNITVGTQYYYQFDAIPTDKARELMAALPPGQPFAYLWVIEVEKDGIELGDVFLAYEIGGAGIYYNGPSNITWNDSQPGKLVAFGWDEPAAWPVKAGFAYYKAPYYYHAGMHGYMNFTAPGEYTIKAYLIDYKAATTWPGVPILDELAPMSPVGSIKVSVTAKTP